MRYVKPAFRDGSRSQSDVAYANAIAASVAQPHALSSSSRRNPGVQSWHSRSWGRGHVQLKRNVIALGLGATLLPGCYTGIGGGSGDAGGDASIGSSDPSA